jgi:hypothetical protein
VSEADVRPRAPVVPWSAAADALADQAKHLSRLSVTAKLRLLEDRGPIEDDFEPTASRGNELDLRTGVCLPNVSRQTDGPRFVVSGGAVLDGDTHG